MIHVHWWINMKKENLDYNYRLFGLSDCNYERTNERTKEKKQTNKTMNKRTNEQTKEQVNLPHLSWALVEQSPV